MITVNGNSIKDINAALLALQMVNTTIYNNSTSTVSEAALASTESIDTTAIYALIKANSDNITSDEKRILALEESIGDLNTTIISQETQIEENTGSISTLLDNFTYWQNYLPYRFYKADNTRNLTNGYGDTQSIELDSGGGSVQYPLTIGSTLLSTATAYDGSAAVTIYSPGQLLETISKPTFAGWLSNGNNDIISTTALSLTTAGEEPLTITNGTLSIGFDSSNIQSRSGSAASILNIKKLGGNLTLCAGGGQISCASAGALIIPTTASTTVGAIWII